MGSLWSLDLRHLDGLRSRLEKTAGAELARSAFWLLPQLARLGAGVAGGGWSEPFTIAMLAEKTACKPRIVRRWLAVLRKSGVVEVKNRGRGGLVLRVTLPVDAAERERESQEQDRELDRMLAKLTPEQLESVVEELTRRLRSESK